MQVLTPSHPPGTACDRFSGFSSPWDFRHGLGRSNRTVTSQLPEIVEEGGGKVYVAVGKSVQKTVSLLRWALRQFPGLEICLLHVHQPSPLIPTLLGKLPASKASSEVVSAFRREEREQTRKLLLNYLRICCRSKVKAHIITTEADQVQKGIVDLVNKNAIGRLVMGAVPENWMKVKKGSSKASYAAKNAPPFCEIWFLSKGKHIWTREASEATPLVPVDVAGMTFVPPVRLQETVTTIDIQSTSMRYNRCEVLFSPDCLRSSSARSTPFSRLGNSVHTESVQEVTFSPTFPFSTNGYNLQNFCCLSSPTSTSSSSGGSERALSAEQRVPSDSERKVEEEVLSCKLAEVRTEAEASGKEVALELLKCKEFEAQALRAISKAKAYESAHAHQVKLRLEAEDALRATTQEHEKLVEEREEVTRELYMAMRSIALLDSRAQEANRRSEEAAEELRLIQASIGSLWHEKRTIRRQKIEATRWLDRWKCHQRAQVTNEVIEVFEDSPELAVFSLSDLETATCNFSESFKIGQGGNGYVYKGEMLDRTVAIKKLHPHSMQGQSEFQLEVEVLGKLQHPRLATLIGACPEAWSLVYEYVPNGNLQDRLFPKSNIHPLSWKNRARIIAEVASALQYLHSFKPENVVHGNLKPENILLDSELGCKICDFGMCRLVPKESLRCLSFRRYTEPKGAFLYTDPELLRTGILTPKSDMYAFGLIILQLLTGRAPTGLATEARRAVSSGIFSSILDSSAGEWPTFVARKLVALGTQCCDMNSRERPELTPTMVKELEQLCSLEERSVPSFFLCPILQEIMHDPQVAADGFTYEGEAICAWLENGRETSPMTNLPLSHLHLTPNHALRQAIRDWLCRS